VDFSGDWVGELWGRITELSGEFRGAVGEKRSLVGNFAWAALLAIMRSPPSPEFSWTAGRRARTEAACRRGSFAEAPKGWLAHDAANGDRQQQRHAAQPFGNLTRRSAEDPEIRPGAPRCPALSAARPNSRRTTPGKRRAPTLENSTTRKDEKALEPSSAPGGRSAPKAVFIPSSPRSEIFGLDIFARRTHTRTKLFRRPTPRHADAGDPWRPAPPYAVPSRHRRAH
jgi:hypothetical protein